MARSGRSSKKRLRPSSVYSGRLVRKTVFVRPKGKRVKFAKSAPFSLLSSPSRPITEWEPVQGVKLRPWRVLPRVARFSGGRQMPIAPFSFPVVSGSRVVRCVAKAIRKQVLIAKGAGGSRKPKTYDGVKC